MSVERKVVLRNLSDRKRVYYTGNQHDDDNYIHCHECNDFTLGMCPAHQLIFIKDRKIGHNQKLSTARQSLPMQMYIHKSPIHGDGVFTKVQLPSLLCFGPYKGKVLYSAELADKSGYAWQIRLNDGDVKYVDAEDESCSNWMRFVNSARVEQEQNLQAFQFQGELYYRTYKSIPQGNELLVYYGDAYHCTLSKFAPTVIKEEQLMPYACTRCDKRFTAESYLGYHMKSIHRNEGVTLPSANALELKTEALSPVPLPEEEIVVEDPVEPPKPKPLEVRKAKLVENPKPKLVVASKSKPSKRKSVIIPTEILVSPSRINCAKAFRRPMGSVDRAPPAKRMRYSAPERAPKHNHTKSNSERSCESPDSDLFESDRFLGDFFGPGPKPCNTGGEDHWVKNRRFKPNGVHKRSVCDHTPKPKIHPSDSGPPKSSELPFSFPTTQTMLQGYRIPKTTNRDDHTPQLSETDSRSSIEDAQGPIPAEIDNSRWDIESVSSDDEASCPTMTADAQPITSPPLCSVPTVIHESKPLNNSCLYSSHTNDAIPDSGGSSQEFTERLNGSAGCPPDHSLSSPPLDQKINSPCGRPVAVKQSWDTTCSFGIAAVSDNFITGCVTNGEIDGNIRFNEQFLNNDLTDIAQPQTSSLETPVGFIVPSDNGIIMAETQESCNTSALVTFNDELVGREPLPLYDSLTTAETILPTTSHHRPEQHSGGATTADDTRCGSVDSAKPVCYGSSKRESPAGHHAERCSSAGDSPLKYLKSVIWESLPCLPKNSHNTDMETSANSNYCAEEVQNNSMYNNFDNDCSNNLKTTTASPLGDDRSELEEGEICDDLSSDVSSQIYSFKEMIDDDPTESTSELHHDNKVENLLAIIGVEKPLSPLPIEPVILCPNSATLDLACPTFEGSESSSCAFAGLDFDNASPRQCPSPTMPLVDNIRSAMERVPDFMSDFIESSAIPTTIVEEKSPTVVGSLDSVRECAKQLFDNSHISNDCETKLEYDASSCDHVTPSKTKSPTNRCSNSVGETTSRNKSPSKLTNIVSKVSTPPPLKSVSDSELPLPKFANKVCKTFINKEAKKTVILEKVELCGDRLKPGASGHGSPQMQTIRAEPASLERSSRLEKTTCSKTPAQPHRKQDKCKSAEKSSNFSTVPKSDSQYEINRRNASKKAHHISTSPRPHKSPNRKKIVNSDTLKPGSSLSADDCTRTLDGHGEWILNMFRKLNAEYKIPLLPKMTGESDKKPISQLPSLPCDKPNYANAESGKPKCTVASSNIPAVNLCPEPTLLPVASLAMPENSVVKTTNCFDVGKCTVSPSSSQSPMQNQSSKSSPAVSGGFAGNQQVLPNVEQVGGVGSSLVRNQVSRTEDVFIGRALLDVKLRRSCDTLAVALPSVVDPVGDKPISTASPTKLRRSCDTLAMALPSVVDPVGDKPTSTASPTKLRRSCDTLAISLPSVVDPVGDKPTSTASPTKINSTCLSSISSEECSIMSQRVISSSDSGIESPDRSVDLSDVELSSVDSPRPTLPNKCPVIKLQKLDYQVRCCEVVLERLDKPIGDIPSDDVDLSRYGTIHHRLPRPSTAVPAVSNKSKKTRRSTPLIPEDDLIMGKSCQPGIRPVAYDSAMAGECFPPQPYLVNQSKRKVDSYNKERIGAGRLNEPALKANRSVDISKPPPIFQQISPWAASIPYSHHADNTQLNHSPRNDSESTSSGFKDIHTEKVKTLKRNQYHRKLSFSRRVASNADDSIPPVVASTAHNNYSTLSRPNVTLVPASAGVTNPHSAGGNHCSPSHSNARNPPSDAISSSESLSDNDPPTNGCINNGVTPPVDLDQGASHLNHMGSPLSSGNGSDVVPMCVIFGTQTAEPARKLSTSELESLAHSNYGIEFSPLKQLRPDQPD